MNKRWRILLLDTKEENPNHYIALGIEDALRQHPQVELVRHVGYSDALPVAIGDRCNLFLAFDGEQLDRGLCKRLAEICGTSALWLTEDPYELPINQRNAELFDVVYTNDSASVERYTNGARHLPLAADPRFHKYEVPSRDDDFLYDLLFVGTAWPNRVSLIKRILADLKGLKVKLALPYNEHLPAPDLDLAPSSYLWKASTPEMARLANRSRVVLTLHRDFSASGGPTSAATPGPRLFETALAGAFQLVDGSLPEISRYFRPGKEIASFNSPEECIALLREYLSKPEERLAMARAAQARCEAEHLYYHRVNELLATIEAGAPPSISDRPSLDQTSIVPAPRPLRVMYVLHNVVNVPPFGGVEVYVDLLVKSLPERYEPWLYFPDRKHPLGSVMVLRDIRGGKDHVHHFASTLDPASVIDAEREAHFGKLLHEFRIDLVHIHHLIGHPLSLPLAARTLGLPTMYTLHDYYSVCSHFNLLNEQRRYCRVPNVPAVTCDLCLAQQDRALPGSQASRRAFVGPVLSAMDIVHLPSQAARAIVESVYPSLKANSRIHVEGIPIEQTAPAPRRALNDSRLKVAIVGSFDHIKGGDALCKVFNAMRDDAVDFNIYGPVKPPFDEILKALNVPNVTCHGAYSPGSIAQELAQMDVALMLSIWPETYVLTLSEAWSAGVVPIVTDIGALGERVQDRMNGLKVPVDEPGSVVERLRELAGDRRELERLRTNIHPGLFRKNEDHIQWVSQRYEELADAYQLWNRTSQYFMQPPDPRPARSATLYRVHPRWLTMQDGVEPQRLRLARLLDIEKIRQYHKQHGTRLTLRHSLRMLLKLLRN